MKNNAKDELNQQKTLDLICIGRIAVDLYGQQIGSKLEDITTFNKYLGGSSGNVAFGTARLGVKSAMLARVGDEQMGQFLRQTLNEVECNTDHLITDKDRLTALVMLSIKDEDTFPLLFYRDNCADMGLVAQDIDENFIASSRYLAITGTHLSHPQTREAVLTALMFARKHNVKTILDIDYRPVLWGLTSLGDGETRFIESDQVTEKLQSVLHYFDIIVGTEEEFHIAGGSIDTITALKTVRQHSQATLVCKRGSLGCSVFEHDIGQQLDDGITVYGFKVDVLNVLGAGDAFLSGLIKGIVDGKDWKTACSYANACGALVVSRHGCAPAMPTMDELNYYIQNSQHISHPAQDDLLNHIHRVTTRKNHYSKFFKSNKKLNDLFILAFDHRIQFINIAQQVNAPIHRIKEIKSLIATALNESIKSLDIQDNAGLLCDSKFGQHVLNEMTGKQLWLARPIEMPSSRPLILEHGNIGTQLIQWPQEHIVKCLVFYSPQDPIPIRLEQERAIQEVYYACCQSGHQLLLEIIMPEVDAHHSHYLNALKRIYNIGIKPDWWKLPPLKHVLWQAISDLIEERDPYCEGIVLLGLDAPKDKIIADFKETKGIEKIRGFAIGRTLFGDAAKSWFANEINDDECISIIKSNYEELIRHWRLANAE